MSLTLDQCERDVEMARAKLATDLATLRSPATFSNFTETVKQEAIRTKDSLVESARTKAQDTVSGMIDDLKAKAAANPAAVLAIAGGLGWWLIRNPPVTTALVGAGLLSLLRTPARDVWRTDDELWSDGKARLKEQVVDAASSARDAAAAAGETIAERATDAFASAQDSIRNRVSEAAGQASDRLQQGKEAIQETLQDTLDRTRQAAADGGQRAAAVVNDATAAVNDAAATARRTGHDLMDGAANRLPSRDSLLLAVAGVAVAGALGIASQRRR